MRKFFTELIGITVMTSEGTLIGRVASFTVETLNGQVKSVLIQPAEDIDESVAPRDSQGRLVVPFQSMKTMRDVVVIDLK